MHALLKKMLVCSLLTLSFQFSNAENFPPTFNIPAPMWGNNPNVIAWGDCVPVPIAPMGMPPANFPMGNSGFPQPMQRPQSIPYPTPTKPFGLLPPPSPFFSTAPSMEPQTLAPPQVANCESDAKLQALQKKYELASSASKQKITELNQALDDTQNQMSDSQNIISNGTKENVALKDKITQLEEELTNLKTLQSKLAALEEEKSKQAMKLSTLGQIDDELTTLKSTYKKRNDENLRLKENLVKLDDENKTLKSQLAQAESESANNLRKLNVLSQSSAELTALKSAYKERNDENASLKQQLDGLDKEKTNIQSLLDSKQTAVTQKTAENEKIIEGLNEKLKLANEKNISLTTQLNSANSNLSSQTRKINVLSQSTKELTALKSVYKERSDENVELKKRLENTDNSGKTLLAKLATANENISSQSRKINALGQAAVELDALKSAYKERNNENAELKKRLSDLDNSSKSLQSKLVTANQNIGSQSRKLTALGQSVVELNALKSAYKSKNDENAALKLKLDGLASTQKSANACQAALEKSEGANKALTTKIATFDKTTSDQAKKITALMLTLSELERADADNDGIVDSSDLCPASRAGSKVNGFGCIPTENITLKGVNFATGSAQLTASSLPILNAAASTIKQNPNLKIEIAGYTDNRGLAYVNQTLSKRRANSVMIELIKQGVVATRLTAKGYGERKPIDKNSTESGRANNRRVELKISN